MGPLDALNHLLNFAAPAMVLACLIPGMAAVLMRKRPAAPGFPGQVAIIFIVCLACQLAGLWLFGVDGKMVTYAALVLAGATAQAIMLARSSRPGR